MTKHPNDSLKQQVYNALFSDIINGSYPADGPRPDNSVQRVVRQPVSVRRLVEVHTTPVTKKEISRLTYLPRRRQRVSYAAVQRRLS